MGAGASPNRLRHPPLDGAGIAYAIADSGDWSVWPGEAIKFLGDFTQVSKDQLLTEFPNVGKLRDGVHDVAGADAVDGPRRLPQGECGIRGLDRESSNGDDGSWTVSASLTANTVAGYLRYGRDLLLPGPSPARLELELCSNTLLDGYVAVRNLWAVSRFSKLGLELGASPHSLHLSLYWSRLGQRLSVPVLLSPRAEHSGAAILFCCAGVAPLVAFAARHFLARPRRTRPTEVDLQAYVARKRAAADEVASLLAGAVEARQRVERQRGGLVVLSAKFGVKNEGGDGGGGDGDNDDGDDWAAEEVADVTLAVAALVEDGGLRIPAGVRKGSLLGFWDPAPLRRKALHVRYLWRGKEGTVEVMGRDELVLPPPRRDVS
ncbi:dnaJ domain-containing protein [Colletotrichum higginsianum]|nr:dnaJ domain-containing protein [Colletotrichum higginsianum]